MSKYLKRFEENKAGNDYCVGDIHGCFSDLGIALSKIGFDKDKDRLFSVGDLVDRGPESEKALEWLSYSWFHPVCGNHDDYVVRYKTCDHNNWIRNGGAWFIGLPSTVQADLCAAFSELPIAIEVSIGSESIGIVHADVVCGDWSKIGAELETKDGRDGFMWSRDRASFCDDTPVKNIKAVIVGHTPMLDVAVLGNVIHIDTGAVFKNKGGRFTILNIKTLEIIQP